MALQEILNPAGISQAVAQDNPVPVQNVVGVTLVEQKTEADATAYEKASLIVTGAPVTANNVAISLNGAATNVAVIGGIAEEASLEITAIPNLAGNITVTLNEAGTDIAVTPGVIEIASLEITGVPTEVGEVIVTLDGVGTPISVDPATETTTALVATKIRNATFAGWTTGGSGATVTFTCDALGIKTDASFNAGDTGVTGTMTTTTQGTIPTLTFTDDISSVELHNTDSSNAGIFTVNGIAIKIPASCVKQITVGGTPSPAITVTGATSYIVSRFE